MKDLGVVKKVPIQWGGIHPVFEAVLLLNIQSRYHLG
jgi:hypothetical protein